MQEDVEKIFPQYKLLILKTQMLTSLAHTSEQWIASRVYLHQVEENITRMQKLTESIDFDLHLLAELPGFVPSQTSKHLLDTIHRMESYLQVLESEVHDLAHPPVVIHHPHHVYHPVQPPVYKQPDHVVINPKGVHLHKGGFGLNIKF